MTDFVRGTVFAALMCLGGGQAYAASPLPPGLPPSAILLLRYDANGDGIVTRTEMEAGLKAAYDAADTNHDGCVDRPEMRAENERRLLQDAGQASPLNDWNLDGCVDMAEFSNTVRSYFGFVDKTKDGAVSLLELRGPSMPLPQPGGNKNADSDKKPGTTADTTPGVSY